MAIHNTTTVSSASFSPKKPQTKTPPVYISTNKSNLNPVQLQQLFSSCNYSPHRFPQTGPDGRIQPVELRKLKIFLAHSSVVVSVYCRAKFLESGSSGFVLGGLFGNSDQILVGFGRAVSDGGLTASIHDILVTPSLRRRGIGRRILERIVKILSSREIYDISALCTEEERLFFKACGLGYDMLGSTTMMYTKSPDPTSDDDDVMVTSAGRMLLAAPPSSYQLKLAKEFQT